MHVETPRTTFAISGLSAFYGDKQIIKDVSLDIKDACVTAFMGPSGCGKSTILRTLNRLHETVPGARVTGSVRFEGGDLYARGVDAVEVRSRIGMVFQKPNPFPKSIYDNIAFAPRLLGLAGAKSDLDGRIEAALKSVGLWTEVKDRLQDSALGLSGGQQQRLVIARAIAADPKALLLDEPCSALDPASTARIEELMADLRSRFAIVIVTHSMAQARRVADEIAFFHLGEMVEHGRPEAILDAPKDRRVQDYVGGRTG